MQLRHKNRETAVSAVPDDIAGIIAGTKVLTMKGEMPVEALTPGIKIITRDTGFAVLDAVTCREMSLAAVRIKAGSLGHHRPETDMRATPGALILLRDWRAQALFGQPQALVPARRLVDGEFVAQEAESLHQVYELTFSKQHIVYADGIELASAAV